MLCCYEETDWNLIYKETRDEILLKAKQLTPREEEVLLASKIEGLNNKELAKRFNISPQRVRNLVSASVKKLTKLFMKK